MTLDKDNEVAVQTMKLLVLISRWASFFLSDFFWWQPAWTSPRSISFLEHLRMFSPLRTTIGSSSSFTAHSALLLQLQGSFSSQGTHTSIVNKKRGTTFATVFILFVRLLSAEGSETLDSMNEEDTPAQQTYTRLKALLRFFQESEVKTRISIEVARFGSQKPFFHVLLWHHCFCLYAPQAHTHVVYLVDSLWDCGGALLKDWATLTSVLLQDSSAQAPGKKTI